MMAQRGVPLMARQSLIGYNYSLLGNFPAEPIFAAPDFYATVLFKRLAGVRVLPLSLQLGSEHAEGGGGRQQQQQQQQQQAGSKLRAYAYCSAAGAGAAAGAVTVVLVNTDGANTVTASVADLGSAVDVYALAPGWDAGDTTSPPLFRATSRKIALNGRVLAVDYGTGALPPMPPRPMPAPAAGEPVRLAVPPLTAMLAVFGEAGSAACAGQ